MTMLLVFLVLLAMIVVERSFGHHVTGADSTSTATDQLMLAGTTLAIGWMFLAPLVVPDLSFDVTWLTVLGGAMGIAGVALRAHAMRSLGKAFALTPGIVPDQQLRTNGPYRRVRHPGYTAIVTFAVGLALLAGNVASLIGPLFIALPLVLRIRVEERILHQHFGDRYQVYCASTRYRVVPLLW